MLQKHEFEVNICNTNMTLYVQQSNEKLANKENE